MQDEIKLIMQIRRGTVSRSWTDVLCVRTQLSLCAQLSSLRLGMRPTGWGLAMGVCTGFQNLPAPLSPP